ncbi:Uncharacterized protein HZ326_25031 [Fusarium oxysporum f. sp. albedinis]|nr:Mesaconyl-C(4)-CoA hydratase [Fusarium oxysporum f. sp. albedinis]KAJ0131887.1 Uncharacterized protein HZ326_25031 [Fusarium oxysporum f. sp. albedinis]
MGDQNDAIKVYISRQCYMEALILTCLSALSVWECQADIARMCGTTRPSAAMTPSIPEALNSPLSPPGVQCVTQRSISYQWLTTFIRKIQDTVDDMERRELLESALNVAMICVQTFHVDDKQLEKILGCTFLPSQNLEAIEMTSVITMPMQLV